jgi:hypothetical protein
LAGLLFLLARKPNSGCRSVYLYIFAPEKCLKIMEILHYNDLNLSKVKKNFNKVLEHLKKGNFAAADVKK